MVSQTLSDQKITPPLEPFSWYLKFLSNHANERFYSRNFSYIIDYETSEVNEKFRPRKWGDLIHPIYDPDKLLELWGLWDTTIEESKRLRLKTPRQGDDPRI